MGKLLVIACLTALAGCRSPKSAADYGPPAPPEHSLEVMATAYNSTVGQTDGRPFHAAWGDSLVPGMRSVAVSRDLLEMGLRPGMLLTIDSLAGRYIVLDKMDARWKRRIDIYFAHDLRAARDWGERRVVIRWGDTTDARPIARSLDSARSAR